MSKISIIGAGSIGATTAFALLQKGVATEIILNDINQEKAVFSILKAGYFAGKPKLPTFASCFS